MTATGALIMAFFATIWWIVGLRAAGYGPTLLFLAPILVAAALVGLWRSRIRRAGSKSEAADEAEDARRGRLVGWASAAEGIGIFIASNVLVNLGHSDAIAPAVALIVGVHFVPLAWGLPAPAYYATAGTLVSLAIAGLFIEDVSTRLTVVSADAAAILWVTAFSVLLRLQRPGKTDREDTAVDLAADEAIRRSTR